MGKRKDRNQPPRKRRIGGESPESRSTDAVTVAWMLATLATLAAQVIAALSLAYLAFQEKPAESPLFLRIAPGIMLSVAALTGVITLALMAATLQLRRSPTPRAIILGSALIAVCPWVVLAVLGIVEWVN